MIQFANSVAKIRWENTKRISSTSTSRFVVETKTEMEARGRKRQVLKKKSDDGKDLDWVGKSGRRGRNAKAKDRREKIHQQADA